MPHLTFPISPDGPVVEVLVGLNKQATAALLQSGSLIPAPIRIRALIDSGADLSAIAQGILQRLGLKRTVLASMHTAGGMTSVQLFEVSLSISGPSGAAGPMLVRPNLLVTELTTPPPKIEALIGMDVLAECLLILDGPGGRFTLAF